MDNIRFLKLFLFFLIFVFLLLFLLLFFKAKEEMSDIQSLIRESFLEIQSPSSNLRVKQYPEKREILGETISPSWQEVAKMEPLDEDKEITIDYFKWCVERTEEHGCSCARILVEYSEGNSYLSPIMTVGGNQIKCREVDYNPLYKGMIKKISLQCASGNPLCGSHCGSQALTKGSLYLTGFEVQ